MCTCFLYYIVGIGTFHPMDVYINMFTLNVCRCISIYLFFCICACVYMSANIHMFVRVASLIYINIFIHPQMSEYKYTQFSNFIIQRCGV